jgi:hypothetical protein
MSNHVAAIEYAHVMSAQRTPYVHTFPRKDGPVKLYALPDGSLRVVGAGRLWDWHVVKDSE